MDIRTFTLLVLIGILGSFTEARSAFFDYPRNGGLRADSPLASFAASSRLKRAVDDSNGETTTTSQATATTDPSSTSDSTTDPTTTESSTEPTTEPATDPTTEPTTETPTTIPSTDSTTTSTSTTTEATSPTTEATSPTTEATSPTTEATSPTTEATSPTTEATSPTTEATSPTTEATSPTTEATSPTTEATSPTTEATSPSTTPTSTTATTPSSTSVTTPVCTTPESSTTPESTKTTPEPKKPTEDVESRSEFDDSDKPEESTEKPSTESPSKNDNAPVFPGPYYGPGFPNMFGQFGPGFDPYFGYPDYNSIPGYGPNYAWTGTNGGPGYASAGAGSFAGGYPGMGYPTMVFPTAESPSVDNRGGLQDSTPDLNGYPAYGSSGIDPLYNAGAGFYFPGQFNDPAFDMIRQIQAQIEAQQRAFAEHMASLQAYIENHGRPYVQNIPTYPHVSLNTNNMGVRTERYRSSNNDDVYQNSYDSRFGHRNIDFHNRLANEAANYDGAQLASASIGIGPNGGYQAGRISPAAPGIESRFAEELPSPSGNNYGVFASSHSSSVTGPDGKQINHKSSSTGVNDNGKISFRTVHD